MTDTPKKKTLTLKRKPTAEPAASASQAPRKRSGARARQVAQLEHERKKQTAAKAVPRPAPAKTPHRQDRSQEHAALPQPAPAASSSSPAASRADQADAPTIVRLQRGAKQSRPSAARLRAQAEVFPIFTPCPHGLEEALAAELNALGFDDVRPGRAGCHSRANWSGIQRANLYSRLATRVLVQVAHGAVRTEDDILDLAYNSPWERWFGAEHTLRVDTSAIRSPMQSLQYCNLRAKDGICDRLRDREGERPSIDTVRPDARVHLFLDENSGTLYLDTSGESLFKRGWRLDKGEAPIRENLAAGILALADWDPSQALMDPFCGSGTILIEAAWIALGVPAGIWRPFGFERLRNHDARHWRDLKDEARSRIATRLDTPLVGIDLNPAAITAARQNAERAWLTPDTIRFEAGDARNVAPPASSGWIVTNPPYGERLPETDSQLWAEWATNLKQNYSGWSVNIITSDLDLPSQLRLKPKRRYPLHNGALDCRLFHFDMVKAAYRR